MNQPVNFAQLEASSCLAWVVRNQMINENQKPFEFSRHRFMIDPYNDISPDQVIMKSAQVGWSVAAILKSIHAANFQKLNVVYVLPTRNVVNDFVTPKVNPLIRRNPTIEQLVKGSDSTSLKQVGDRFIYFRGAFHEGEAISITADLVVADEFDRSDQHILTIYQSRLQASDYGWYWRFSNPSVPGFGVHEYWQDSDQMHWLISCGQCKHEAHMDFELDEHAANHYVDMERAIYACGRCREEITDDDRQSGRWLARYPERPRRGYWISQLMVPWVSATKIIQQYEEMSVEVFHNFVLGLPYQASELLVNRQSILNILAPASVERRGMILGVDNGKVKHWVLGSREGIVAYGKTEDWSEIERMIKSYEATCVIDALPDFTVPQQLAKKYPGKVYVHYYVHNAKDIDVSRIGEGSKASVIQSDRTKLFDRVASEITSGELRIHLRADVLEDFIYHWENMYRIIEIDPKGIERGKWDTKANKPDHWAHATAYWRVGVGHSLTPGEAGGVRPQRPGTHKGLTILPGGKMEANMLQKAVAAISAKHKKIKVK